MSFPILCSGAATHRRPCVLIVPWSRAYFVATVRVERNFWTCRFCETWGSVCESAERFGTAPICEPRTLASIRDGHKTCYTAPKSYRPHLRRERLHLDATAPASCKNLVASAPSRGEISIPSLWDAETPLDAAAALPAAARGAGTLRDAAAAVQREREARERCARASGGTTPQRRRRESRRGTLAQEAAARPPPAPAGTA